MTHAGSLGIAMSDMNDCSDWVMIINLKHDDLLHVEVSTGVCICWISRCKLQRISQSPMMIEICSNFLNTLY